MRTTIYVDGFNLYFRALRRTPYRWLDLHGLSRQLLHRDNRIERIRYFTARVIPAPGRSDDLLQAVYLRAIAAHIPCLQVHEGHFMRHIVRMPLAYPDKCGPRSADVIKTEEKGSDVNLAVHLVNDACEDAFDVALVISNDSDLAEAIRVARDKGKVVGVANPNADRRRPMNAALHGVASFRRRIEARHLRNAQLPERIPGTPLVKPSGW